MTVGYSVINILGDPTPKMTLDLTSSSAGGLLTINATVYNPSFIASGVHVELMPVDEDEYYIQANSELKDGSLVSRSNNQPAQLTLGNIGPQESRSVSWGFVDGNDSKKFTFRAWSENGGTIEKSIILNCPSPCEFDQISL